ncbi:DddA-like double-stranded DNA deaminase toxin [Amycolatopsis orientalis]|uniref:DddA-like double-stranded DNA deaminase toxin n=1 Tax=Amycolatopsis orientalis TaxID=31958 RepID=UPI0003A04569|nr:DddA-like double-stranded DNA deaminase toxin [Amycolatopsis orientalis]
MIGEVTALWGQAVEGTHDPAAAQLPALAETLTTGVGECHAATGRAEQLLTGYLGTLGVAEPTGKPPPDPPARAERVAQARARVGRAEVAGGQAQGEWVRSDGSSVPVASGRGDDGYESAARFVAEGHAPRPAARLATHIEVKIAMAMREQGLRDETVVIDRQVCGTREFDREAPFTCDKYLARFLPPGARLRVEQPDGTVSEYTGTETEQQQ